MAGRDNGVVYRIILSHYGEGTCGSSAGFPDGDVITQVHISKFIETVGLPFVLKAYFLEGTEELKWR